MKATHLCGFSVQGRSVEVIAAIADHKAGCTAEQEYRDRAHRFARHPGRRFPSLRVR